MISSLSIENSFPRSWIYFIIATLPEAKIPSTDLESMKRSPRIIWKTYTVLFSLIVLARFVALTHTETEPYIFYHILIAWSDFFKIHYYLAVSKIILTIVCLYPLWAFSFHKELHKNYEFWQWLLVLRIMLEIAGSYYEFVFMKASFHMFLAYGLTVTGAILLPLIPSYVAHYLFVFPKKSIPRASA